MNEGRTAVVDKAFQKLFKTEDGSVTLNNLK